MVLPAITSLFQPRRLPADRCDYFRSPRDPRLLPIAMHNHRDDAVTRLPCTSSLSAIIFGLLAQPASIGITCRLSAITIRASRDTVLEQNNNRCNRGISSWKVYIYLKNANPRDFQLLRPEIAKSSRNRINYSRYFQLRAIIRRLDDSEIRR